MGDATGRDGFGRERMVLPVSAQGKARRRNSEARALLVPVDLRERP